MKTPKIDKYGRLYIPKEIRDKVDFLSKDNVQIEIRKGKSIFVKSGTSDVKIISIKTDITGRLILYTNLGGGLRYEKDDKIRLISDDIIVLSENSIGKYKNNNEDICYISEDLS
ncbi:MAG: hypothetical protein FWE02_00515 [Defluviitaleaceae bacterium]|nr:hypothetical protein [Defluviitaleaceae bacterium]